MPSAYPAADNAMRGVFYREQAQALAAAHDVAVLAVELSGWWQRGGRSRGESCEHDGNTVVYRQGGVKAAPISWLPGPEYNAWLSAARRGYARVAGKWGRPDIIHAHVTLPAGWGAIQLGREAGVPVVITEHSSAFEEWTQGAVTRRLLRDALVQAQLVIAVSPSLAVRIKQFDPSVYVQVVGNVVTTDRFVPAEAEQATEVDSVKRFLCVAALKPVKGVEYLIRAAAKLRERGMDAFEVNIGGSGPERDRLENLVAALDLAQIVHFLDFMGKDEVVTQMQRSTALVVPSRTETFSVVAAEAMACGLPVIATRCGGPESFVTEESGVLVEPESPAALADAMAEVISGRRRYDAAAIRRSIVERFSPATITAQLSSLYSQVLNRAR